MRQYDGFNSTPNPNRPFSTATYTSEPIPANGDNTTSPLLDHSRTQRAMKSNCSGQMCRSSALSRATRSFNVFDSSMSNQIGCAHSIYSLFVTSVSIGTGFSPGLRNISR